MFVGFDVVDFMCDVMCDGWVDGVFCNIVVGVDIVVFVGFIG